MFGFSKCYFRTKNRNVSKTSMAQGQSPAPCQRLCIKLEEAGTAPWSLQTLAGSPAHISTASQLSANCLPSRGVTRGGEFPEADPGWLCHNLGDFRRMKGRGIQATKPGENGQEPRLWSQQSKGGARHSSYLLCDVQYVTSLLQVSSPLSRKWGDNKPASVRF